MSNFLDTAKAKAGAMAKVKNPGTSAAEINALVANGRLTALAGADAIRRFIGPQALTPAQQALIATPADQDALASSGATSGVLGAAANAAKPTPQGNAAYAGTAAATGVAPGGGFDPTVDNGNDMAKKPRPGIVDELFPPKTMASAVDAAGNSMKSAGKAGATTTAKTEYGYASPADPVFGTGVPAADRWAANVKDSATAAMGGKAVDWAPGGTANVAANSDYTGAGKSFADEATMGTGDVPQPQASANAKSPMPIFPAVDTQKAAYDKAAARKALEGRRASLVAELAQVESALAKAGDK